MSLRDLNKSVNEFVRPHWYLLGVSLALIGAAFVFASQSLVIYSRAFLFDAAVYVVLQVSGWVILIEWLRIAGYLTLASEGREPP